MRRSRCARALVCCATLCLSACTKSRPHDGGVGGYGGVSAGSIGGRPSLAARDGGAEPKRRRAVIDAGDGTRGPFKCRDVQSVCNLLERFPTRSGVSWGDGDDFHAGVSLRGYELERDPDESKLHVTGKVARAGVGFALWFDDCINLTRYRGLRFVLQGKVRGTVPELEIALPTNGNFPFETAPTGRKGACVSSHPSDPFVDCAAATAHVKLSAKPNMLPWNAWSGGKPHAWEPGRGPSEVLGVEFRFPWHEGAEPYEIDVTLDDFGFIADHTAECAVFPEATEADVARGAENGAGGRPAP